MNIWRLIALPMALLCAVLTVLYLFVWYEPYIAFGGFVACLAYCVMFTVERRRK